MHVGCPHCRNHIEIDVNASSTDIICPSCGTIVDLVLDGSRKRNERVRAPTANQGTKQVRSGSAISGAHT